MYAKLLVVWRSVGDLEWLGRSFAALVGSMWMMPLVAEIRTCQDRLGNLFGLETIDCCEPTSRIQPG